MKSGIPILVTLFAATAAVAGPYDQPWSLVEAGTRSDVRKEAPVAITQVDGTSTRNPRATDPLAPGPHKVTVRYETARGVAADATRELDLKLEGCTRYRVVAAYRTVAGPEWEPKVYPEPIGECRKKFKDAGK
jgi:hypothetical protein